MRIKLANACKAFKIVSDVTSITLPLLPSELTCLAKQGTNVWADLCSAVKSSGRPGYFSLGLSQAILSICPAVCLSFSFGKNF